MMAVVLGYLVLSWLPYFVLLPGTTLLQAVPPWLHYGMDAATFLVYTNSAVNPIIYGWLNRDFRKAYVAILSRNRTKLASEGNNVFKLSRTS